MEIHRAIDAGVSAWGDAEAARHAANSVASINFEADAQKAVHSAVASSAAQAVQLQEQLVSRVVPALLYGDVTPPGS